MGRQLGAVMLSPFVGQRLRMWIAMVRPLAEVPDAIRNLHQGHARGKLVITVW